MPIIVKGSDNAPREPIPSGNYAARCYQMIHVGTNEEVMPNKEVKHLNKVRIGWEIPELTKVFDESKGPQPLVISQEYTMSLSSKANLRAMLKSWRGKDFTAEQLKGFDIATIVGASCLLNIVIVDGKSDATVKYNQIAGVTPLPKGLVCGDPVNPPQILSYDNFDHELCESLPDFIKNKIKSSEEYREMQSPNHVQPTQAGHEEEDDQDLPF